MKPLLLALLVALTSAISPPTPSAFRYQRALAIDPSTNPSPNACAVLDADVFAHANPLADLRVYAAGSEVPYAITFSGTAEPVGDPARILNLGLRSPHRLSFDLQMPSRPYSEVELTLNAKDFLASARVEGLSSLTDRKPIFLGTFTIFDLTTQHLGRNSTLPLAESTFPYLHIDLDLTPAPGADTLNITPAIVASAEIPPSRLAQTLYTPVAQTSTIAQRPRESIATFTIPAGMPVERVTVFLDPADRTNFSRAVTITAKPTTQDPPVETLTGEISRIRLTESGQEIHEQSLSIPAILGSNAQSPATVEVAIQNGDDRPLHIASVVLSMRQRKLCFEVPASPPTLFYGAPTVPAPVYDFSRLFYPAEAVRTASLAPEQLNPEYTAPAPEKRPLTERYPQLLWVALLFTISILAAIAFRSAKRIT